MVYGDTGLRGHSFIVDIRRRFVEGKRCQKGKGVRNRLLTRKRELGRVSTWEDQSDQCQVVGFIMC